MAKKPITVTDALRMHRDQPDATGVASCGSGRDDSRDRGGIADQPVLRFEVAQAAPRDGRIALLKVSILLAQLRSRPFHKQPSLC